MNAVLRLDIHLYHVEQSHQSVINLVQDLGSVVMMLTMHATQVLVHHALFYARNGVMENTNKEVRFLAIKKNLAVDYHVENLCYVADTNVPVLVI